MPSSASSPIPCERGERCTIPGLGSFAVTHRKAREGRNPAHQRKDHHPGLEERPLQSRQGSAGLAERAEAEEVVLRA